MLSVFDDAGVVGFQEADVHSPCTSRPSDKYMETLGLISPELSSQIETKVRVAEGNDQVEVDDTNWACKSVLARSYC
jgi:hypothetical protein